MLDVYTRPTCIWCIRAKELLNSKGIPFKNLDINDDELREELKVKAPGIKTIPQIFIGDHYIGGNDQLQNANRSGELDKLLKS